MPSLTLIALLAAPLLLVLLGLRWVPEGTAYTVRRFGRYARTLSPGLRFALPVLERVSAPVALINHRVQLPLDAAQSSAPAAFYYQIVEPARAGERLDDIDQVVEREVRQFLDQALSAASRDIDALNGRVKQALNDRLATMGLRVTRCQLGA